MKFVKQHMYKVVLGVALVCAFALPASAQDLKIGFVNIQALMEGAPQTKASMDALPADKGIHGCTAGRICSTSA